MEKIIKVRIIYFIIMVLFLFGCRALNTSYTREDVSHKISNKFEKLTLGMDIEEVINYAGEPDRKRLVEYSVLNKTFLRNDKTHIFYLEAFINDITNDTQILFYNYPVEGDRITAFCLFLDRRGRLLGVSCSKKVLPKNWDDIKNNLNKIKNGA